MKFTKEEALMMLAINQGCPEYGISPMPMGKEMVDAITEALKDESNIVFVLSDKMQNGKNNNIK